jgi:hypothetical protein
MGRQFLGAMRSVHCGALALERLWYLCNLWIGINYIFIILASVFFILLLV